MRTKIALRNLYISQAIILSFLIFAYFAWFPHSFSKLGGFYDTAWMLILVDLVLGPLLVFIVYREGKKYLTFDINVLLAIQLGAFAFGAYSLYLKHPTYAVFAENRFTLINTSLAAPQHLLFDKLKPSFISPTFVFAKLPDNIEQRTDYILGVAFSNNPSIEERSDFYVPLETHADAILANDINLEPFLLDASTKDKIVCFLAKHGGKEEDYAFFPLSGNNKKSLVWALDRNSLKPVGIIDIDPWLFSTKKRIKKNKTSLNLYLNELTHFHLYPHRKSYYYLPNLQAQPFSYAYLPA